MKNILNLAYKIGLAIFLDACILGGMIYIYIEYLSEESTAAKVQEMYKKIKSQTGQAQDGLPLYVVKNPIDNAWNTGTAVVMTTGFIKNHNWDEIALVLGHEIAHGMLGHLNIFSPMPDQINHSGMGSNDNSAVLEALADKMGAVYMMKAGYDVCEGREIFKHWKARHGNYLGQTHPDYDYRYAELNINCGD